MEASKKDKLVILSAFGSMLILALSITLIFAKPFEYDPLKPRYFGSGGEVIRKQPLYFDAIIVPTGAAMTIDYSTANFTTVQSITITPENNTTAVVSMPLASIKTWSSTSCTVNILQSNSQAVSVLGSTVAGLTTATNLTGMKLHIHIVGW